MKNYRVVFRFGGRVAIVYFEKVIMCKRIVNSASPFSVVEFFRNGKLVAEFYPSQDFKYEIDEYN